MKLRNIIISSLLVGTVVLGSCGKKSEEAASQTESTEVKTVTITLSGEEDKISSTEAAPGSIGTGEESGAGTSAPGNTDTNESSTTSEDASQKKETSEDSKSGDIWSSKDRDVIFSHDFTDDIKKDISDASASSSSLTDELSRVEKVTEKYEDLFKIGEAQLELNMASGYTYMIWDEELNSLWKRFSSSADAATKERVLRDERNWIAMKEEVMIENIGRREDSGSIYPMLENSFLQNITRNRCDILASELAKITGESFTLPERDIYGTYVDNQGTGDVYSSLVLRKGWENEDEAVISLYRVGETSGTFTDKGNGELSYESNDGNVKGIIRINGWKGADFEVTEAKDSALSAGDKFDFGFVF
ncbi:hypothetical protein BXO88_13600 [Oribacterium sp. C9]|uniref:lysozyme inhibitor LprI family protein n=1 Tax=Oribacterium sp. C9 TaxID=1943579 RepID=UPI0009CB4CE8|nr:lysozyme inhibitor LprI family protein [Oribacterium sp. C9]OON85188.1 hypothetical protein BXO88_13600 [Oribacterium sp. C9]